MKQKFKNPPINIVFPPVPKRVASFFIDFLLTVVFIIIGYVVSNPIAKKNMNFDQMSQEYISFIEDCKLYKASGNSYTLEDYTDESLKLTKKEAANKYNDQLTYYYQTFVSKDNRATFLTGDEFKGSRGNDEDVGNWMLSHIYKVDASNKYFETSLSLDNKPVIKEGLTDEVLTELCHLFISSDKTTGYTITASYHFQSQPYFVNRASSMAFVNYVALLPGFVLSPFIFFLLIPLCIPNGKTIGKLILRMAVVSSSFYKAKKYKVLFHYLPLFLCWELLCLTYFNLGLAIVLTLLLFMIDFLWLNLSKRHMSIHDLISRSIVIDSKESMWFASKEDEQIYVKAHPDSRIAKYFESLEATNDDK